MLAYDHLRVNAARSSGDTILISGPHAAGTGSLRLRRQTSLVEEVRVVQQTTTGPYLARTIADLIDTPHIAVNTPVSAC